MAIDRPSLLRSIDFAIVAISLVVIGSALGCLVFVTVGHAAAELDPAVRRYLVRLSWIALTLLLFVVVLFAWLVVRYVSHRMRQRRQPPQPTPYLDAWALAGKRFKLTEKDEQEMDKLERDLTVQADDKDGRNDKDDDREQDRDGEDKSTRGDT